MSVIADQRRTNSIALSRHWKQILSNRFQLVVSSDLLSHQQCGKTKLQELNGATSTPAGECSSFEKDPRKKKGNDQRLPLLDVSGYDACKIIEEQGRFSNIREGRIFPYNGRSVGAAFRRQCRDLKIDDLHFHAHRLPGAGWRDRSHSGGSYRE